jgi:hypothetical protein
MGKTTKDSKKTGGTVTLKLSQSEARSLLLALTHAIQGGAQGKQGKQGKLKGKGKYK